MSEKKKPKIKVLDWPAVPTPTPDEVYAGVSDEAKAYNLWLESVLRQEFNANKPEALQGIRVLDVTQKAIIGHWCSSLFAELGAEVIMVEPPGGDPLRKLTPFGREEYMFADKETGEKVGARFLAECRNKLSITLNLETEEGREILRKLAKHADVLIENYPPGQFDEWGIGYRQLSEINPRLVYCWVGQKGQWGPDKDKPWALDPVAQNACGFTHGTGAPKQMGGRPVRSGWWMCDQVGGTFAAIGIMAALYARDSFYGKGQFVEGTGAEGVIRILDYNWAWYGMDGSIRPRYGNWDLAINIYAVNPCADGQIMVGGGHDRLWYRIWRTVGKEKPELEDHIVEDPKLRVVTDRLPHHMQVKTYTCLVEWMREHTRYECETALQEEEVASGGVAFIDEVCEFPHYKYRGHLEVIDDTLYGKVLIGSSVFIGYRTPGRVKWIGRPTGYDNEDVYRRLLGFTRYDLEKYKKLGVI
ncbi:MAG: CoA transferase [Deltaproteobacteria bacterium]|nr:MAG: CoA transferase [Deltaproteobacteria bacterium]